MATNKPIKINHVLYYCEWLKIDKENKFENYMRLSSRATSPQSAIHNDGLPRARDPHAREKLLTRAGDALAAYYDADKKYWNYKDFLESNIDKLQHKYWFALSTKYIWNLHRPREKRINGIARGLGIRRAEVPALVEEAKAALADLLRAQGMDIE